MKITGKAKTPSPPVFDPDGYQANLHDLNGTPLPNLKEVKVRPLGWGGARPGAGRRASGRQPVQLRLTPKTLRTLRATARREGKTLSDLVEERLAAT